MKLFFSLLTAIALGTASLASAQSAPETVSSVDVQEYMGTWYEIESIPKIFQLGCTATTAEYTLRDDGKVDVHNSCKLFTPGGLDYSVKGEARVVDTESNAKLVVNFFSLIDGDYWIFDLAPDYSYALVGSPDFDSLWILSRSRSLSPDIIEALKSKASALGFDVSLLKATKQPAE